MFGTQIHSICNDETVSICCSPLALFLRNKLYFCGIDGHFYAAKQETFTVKKKKVGINVHVNL